MTPFRVSAVLLALTSLPAALAAQSAPGPVLQVTPSNRTISVSASDHAEADAEVADLNVGYIVYGATLQAAYKAASESSNAITKAMLDAGAERSQVQSRSQRVQRLQDYEIKLQRGMKYSVSQSWTVSVDPKIAALILDAAVQAGGNESGTIRWRMKNSVTLDGEAIHRATERAQAIAAELARSMGVKLGLPLYATNSVNSTVETPRFMMNELTDGVAGMPKASRAPLSVQAQRVDAVATVQIIYAIE